MPIEIVKQRRAGIPRYVLAYFKDYDSTNVVPREKISNEDAVREFLMDPSRPQYVQAKFLVIKNKTREEVEYEGLIIGAKW